MNKNIKKASIAAAILVFAVSAAVLIKFVVPGGSRSENAAAQTSEESRSVSADQVHYNQQAQLAEKSSEPPVFEKGFAAATHVIDAEYLGEYKTEMGQKQLMFSPKEVIKGSPAEDVIYMTQPYVDYMLESREGRDKGYDKMVYTKGERYLLVVQKHSYVYDEHAEYALMGDWYFPENSQAFEETLALAKKLAATQVNTAPESYGLAFTHSDDIKEILKASENIFWVQIQEGGAKSLVSPVTEYKCKITKVLKGKPDSQYSISVPFFNDTIKPGEEYIILLSDNPDGGSVYNLSSRNSIYSCEDLDKLPPELKALLETATDFETKPNPTYEELLEQEHAGAK